MEERKRKRPLSASSHLVVRIARHAHRTQRGAHRGTTASARSPDDVRRKTVQAPVSVLRQSRLPESDARHRGSVRRRPSRASRRWTWGASPAKEETCTVVGFSPIRRRHGAKGSAPGNEPYRRRDGNAVSVGRRARNAGDSGGPLVCGDRDRRHRCLPRTATARATSRVLPAHRQKPADGSRRRSPRGRLDA